MPEALKDDWSEDNQTDEQRNASARQNEFKRQQDQAESDGRSSQDQAAKTKPLDRPEHQVMGDGHPYSESGKDIGLVHAPIVSMHPTSGNKGDQPKKEFEVFGNANRYLRHTGPKHDFAYPFLDMEIGQGFFVPVEANSNIDKLIAHLHKAVNQFHKQTAVQEKNENGDDIMESVTELPKKRLDDGVIQLDGTGKPLVGANHTNRPKLVHMAQFLIRSATKDDEIAEGKKAESDGALVIRVA